jgi:DNA-binding response OmpR family regulator
VLDHLKGRLVGAHAYLTKPFKTQEILAVVQAKLGSLIGERMSNLTVEATHPW